jgi:cytochrome c553
MIPRHPIGAAILAAALAAAAGGPAWAQANLDAGKSPAKLFAQGCGACHGSPQELVDIRRDFLVQHYTTGPEQAEQIAAYLESVRHAPQKPRRSPRAGIEVADMISTGSIGATLPEPVETPEAPPPDVTPPETVSAEVVLAPVDLDE